MVGTVTNIYEDLIDVEFPESSPDYDRTVDRWSIKIAPVNTRSKNDQEWRVNNLCGGTDVVVDCFDGNDWMEATIFETRMEEMAPGRMVEVGFVAFRVYRATGRKKDARGNFDGWGPKYDEWIPIISPYFARHNTKGIKGHQPEYEDTGDEDAQLEKTYVSPDGFERVYAVPRIYMQ